jgi:hypothetical protein
MSFRSAALELSSVSLTRPTLLAPAVLLMAIAVFGLGLVWAFLLRWLTDSRDGIGPTLRFFVYTWPGRYVPGTLPYHAARVLFAERIGVSRSAVIASITYEAILQAGVSASIGVLLVLASSASTGWSILVMLLPICLLPLVLQRRLFVPVSSRLLRLARREVDVSSLALADSKVLLAAAGYASVQILNGLAFFLVILSVTDATVHPVLAIGAYSLAGAAGLAAVFMPGGLGVREAVIVGVLSSQMSSTDALVVAGLARGLSLAGDLASFLLVLLASSTRYFGPIAARTRRESE